MTARLIIMSKTTLYTRLLNQIQNDFSAKQLFTIGVVTCYITGFIITNAYFGRLGVISFDFLKPRYMLCGLVFFVFIFPSLALIYLALKTQPQNSYPTSILLKKIFEQIIPFGFYTIILIFFMGVISGSRDKINPHTQEITRNSFLLRVGIVVFLGITLCTLINSTILPICKFFWSLKKKINSFKFYYFLNAKPAFNHKKKGKLYVFIETIAALLPLYLLFFVYQNWLISHKISLVCPIWFSFGISSLGCFSILMLMFSCIFFFFKKCLDSVKSEDESWQFFVIIFSLIWFVGFASQYILSVYPTLPPHFGGGEQTEVEIILKENVQIPLLSTHKKTSLLDRTDSRLLLVVENAATKEQSILELPSEIVQGIIYKK